MFLGEVEEGFDEVAVIYGMPQTWGGVGPVGSRPRGVGEEDGVVGHVLWVGEHVEGIFALTDSESRSKGVPEQLKSSLSDGEGDGFWGVDEFIGFWGEGLVLDGIGDEVCDSGVEVEVGVGVSFIGSDESEEFSCSSEEIDDGSWGLGGDELGDESGVSTGGPGDDLVTGEGAGFGVSGC